MNVYEAMNARHSVRDFLDRPIEEDKLERLLRAAQAAPSGRNLQEWKLVVVRDPARRRELARVCEQPFVAKAPAVLALVATDPDRMMSCGVPAAPVDGAIALDHLSLAAVEEGLGTCWIGHFNQDAARKLLGVPASGRIIEMMLAGYPADRPGQRTRKPLAQLVCNETFG
jgi:nitroreductase